MHFIDSVSKNHIGISTWLLILSIMTFLMIVIGGLTRLTESGLSMVDWNPIMGTIPPLSHLAWVDAFDNYKMTPEFQIVNKLMSLNEFKYIFWWEWFHRFLGRLIGILFLIPLIFFTYKENFKKLVNLYLIFFLICFQGFIGWHMVSSGLVYRIDVSHFRLSIHLIIAFIITSLILWNYFNLKINRNFNDKFNYSAIFIFLLLIFGQITIGALVSGMDAGQIYNSWPLMGSSFFPADNEIINIFKLSAFSDPSLVQFMHRNLAYIILIFYLIILFKIYKKKLINLYFAINLVGLLLLIQIILGIFTLLYGAQILIASMHQISSIFLVSSSVYLLYLNSKSN